MFPYNIPPDTSSRPTISTSFLRQNQNFGVNSPGTQVNELISKDPSLIMGRSIGGEGPDQPKIVSANAASIPSSNKQQVSDQGAKLPSFDSPPVHGVPSQGVMGTRSDVCVKGDDHSSGSGGIISMHQHSLKRTKKRQRAEPLSGLKPPEQQQTRDGEHGTFNIGNIQNVKQPEMPTPNFSLGKFRLQQHQMPSPAPPDQRGPPSKQVVTVGDMIQNIGSTAAAVSGPHISMGSLHPNTILSSIGGGTRGGPGGPGKLVERGQEIHEPLHRKSNDAMLADKMPDQQQQQQQKPGLPPFGQFGRGVIAPQHVIQSEMSRERSYHRSRRGSAFHLATVDSSGNGHPREHRKRPGPELQLESSKRSPPSDERNARPPSIPPGTKDVEKVAVLQNTFQSTRGALSSMNFIPIKPPSLELFPSKPQFTGKEIGKGSSTANRTQSSSSKEQLRNPPSQELFGQMAQTHSESNKSEDSKLREQFPLGFGYDPVLPMSLKHQLLGYQNEQKWKEKAHTDKPPSSKHTEIEISPDISPFLMGTIGK
jgi:hypothetical protein